MFSVCKNRTTSATVLSHTFTVKEWHREDAFPDTGPEVGVDTETELITDSVKIPPLVVLGCYNPLDNTCYITPYEDAQCFMQQMLIRGPRIYLANAGFDYYELWSKALEEHCDRGGIVDIILKRQLYEIATVGYQCSYSLEDCCKNVINYAIDKHKDEGDASVRLNFRRTEEATEQALQYLGIDCFTTWLIGSTVPEMPTQVVETWGNIVLTHTSANGFPVDPIVFDFFESTLKYERDKYHRQLLDMGFPDRAAEKKASYVKVVKDNWTTWQTLWLESALPNEQYKVRKEVPNTDESKRLILYLVNVMRSGNSAEELARTYALVRCAKNGYLKKAEKDAWNSFVDQYDFIGPLDTCKKHGIWPCIVKSLVETSGYGEEEVMAELDALIQEHTEWFQTKKPIGPRDFLQAYLHKLCEDHPEIDLPKTDTGLLKCSKKNYWILEDAHVKDPLLEVYTNYGHCRKYVETYCNREFLASDGKVHPRFGIVSSGRSSCVKPNIQNYPSHDAQYSLKYMFVPPKGTVIVSCDWSFAELVALAEDIVQEFGHSILADVINADLDPHYFFAGCMKGIIAPDTSFCSNPDKVHEVSVLLKEKIPKEVRQLAKAANFGLPGGMRDYRFFQHLRENGFAVTLEDAHNLRNAWFKCFSDMTAFMTREPMKVDPYKGKPFRTSTQEWIEQQDEPEDNPTKDRYTSISITGFVRNRCTYNSGLNLRFQNPVANLAKRSLWNLEKWVLPNGDRFGNRLLNFVHDTCILCAR